MDHVTVNGGEKKKERGLTLVVTVKDIRTLIAVNQVEIPTNL